MTRLIPLSELDATFVYLERPGEPWSSHHEVRVAGRLDPERVVDAVRVAGERHPMMRARMAPFRARERSYQWELQDHLEAPKLTVASCTAERDLEGFREQLLRASPSLDAAPPFELGLAHLPEGDALIMNIHHAATDGTGAHRILTSILRAYAGVDDPVATLDPLAARDPRPLVSLTRRERLRALRKLLVYYSGSTTKPMRMVPQGIGGSADGVYPLVFDERETAALVARRRGLCTTNDLLLAGLALAIRRWNADRGVKPARISLLMPVNLRPRSWSNEVPGNLFASPSISIPRADPDDLETLAATVGRRTQRARRDHVASTLFDLAGASMRRLSIGAKGRLGMLLPQGHDRMQDTAVLTNLGRLEALPDLGADAGPVQGVLISPPIRYTRGVAIGAVGYAGRLQLTVRYHNELFDRVAIAAFGQLYREILLGGEGGQGTTEDDPSSIEPPLSSIATQSTDTSG
jgi:NRPS condensation-like uncharacterized protein